MDRKVRNMIIAITAVIVLAAMLVVLTFLPNDQNYTGEDISLILNTKTQEDITSVKVKNTNDSYTVEASNGHCTISALEGLPTSDQAFNTLKANASDIRASQVVTEEAPNLSDYGLSEPVATAEIHYKDGSSLNLSIGSEAPMSAGTYVSSSASSRVYLFNKEYLEAFHYTKVDYVDKSVVPTKDASGANLTLNNILLKGGSRPADVEMLISMGADNSTVYTVKSAGIQSAGDSTIAPAIASEIKNLKADKITQIKPTDAQLQNYGLKEPFCRVVLTYSNRTVEVITSTEVDGKYYLMNTQYPIIYEIQSSSADWVTADFDTLASKTIINVPLSSVNNLTIQTPDKSYVFNATTSTAPNSGSDSSKVSSAVTEVTCNGSKIDGTNFKIFYQNMLGLKVDNFTTDKPAAGEAPAMSITLKHNESGKQDDRYDFYSWAANESDSLVLRNGECNSAVNTEHINKLLEDCEKLLRGEAISSAS